MKTTLFSFILIPILSLSAYAQIPLKTEAQISLMPDKFSGSHPQEKARSLQEMLSTSQGENQWKRLRHNQLQKALNAKVPKINGRDTRVAQVKKSISTKILPSYQKILHIAQNFSIPADIIIASLLSENSLATSNTDSIQEGLSGAVKLFDLGGDIHSSYRNYEKKMQGSSCQNLHSSKLFLCLAPKIGEPQVPGIGRSYGPAQIDLLTAASIADEVGIFDQMVNGNKVTGAFGPRPPSWAAILQTLDHHLHSMSGAVTIIAANMSMASRLYAEKGWDIRENMPVLVTLQRIGKIAQRAESIKAPGTSNYYPGADTFGIYAMAMEQQGIIDMVHKAAAQRASMKELNSFIEANLP